MFTFLTLEMVTPEVHVTHSQACKHKGQFDDYYQKHLDFFMHFEKVILLLEKYSKNCGYMLMFTHKEVLL